MISSSSFASSSSERFSLSSSSSGSLIGDGLLPCWRLSLPWSLPARTPLARFGGFCSGRDIPARARNLSGTVPPPACVVERGKEKAVVLVNAGHAGRWYHTKHLYLRGLSFHALYRFTMLRKFLRNLARKFPPPPYFASNSVCEMSQLFATVAMSVKAPGAATGINPRWIAPKIAAESSLLMFQRNAVGIPGRLTTRTRL